MIEILSRLPVKSIARCRCVSKLWSSILSRTDFTELVLARSVARPKLLFVCIRDDNVFFFSSPQRQIPDENPSLIVPNCHIHFTFEDSSAPMLYYVHGLICVKNLRILKGRNETVLVACNPSTAQSLTLPRVKTRRLEVMSFFGYDPIDKQFKLLSMTRSSKYGRRNNFSEEHQVMTLGGNGKLIWRMIECSAPHYPLCDGICINGALYYRASVKGFEGNPRIACFDVRSEKFKFIEKGKADIMGLELVNYKGKLATLTSDERYYVISGTTRSFELCVLEDAEKHEWSTHTYVLPPSWKDTVAGVKFYIIGVSTTGEIVLSPFYPDRLSYLIYYNLEKNIIIKVEIQGMDVFKHRSVYRFLNHVEDVKLGGIFRTS